MQWSHRLKKLVSIVEDVQVELRKIMRELGHVYDEELEGLIVEWVKELEEADAHLEEAADIMWDVAEDMEREGL